MFLSISKFKWVSQVRRYFAVGDYFFSLSIRKTRFPSEFFLKWTPVHFSIMKKNNHLQQNNAEFGWVKQRGQGLIEALMIAVFVGVDVMAFISFQNYLTYTTSLAQQQSDANLLVASEIESLRDFGVLNTTSGYTAYQQIVTSSGTSTIGNTTYTLNWTVTPASGLSYVTVNITASWTDRRSLAQSVRLITNIAGVDPGIPASYM